MKHNEKRTDFGGGNVFVFLNKFPFKLFNTEFFRHDLFELTKKKKKEEEIGNLDN